MRQLREKKSFTWKAKEISPKSSSQFNSSMMHGRSERVTVPTPYAYTYSLQKVFADSNSVSQKCPICDPIVSASVSVSVTSSPRLRGRDEEGKMGKWKMEIPGAVEPIGWESDPIPSVPVTRVPLSTCLCLFGFYCLNAFVICCTNWSFTQPAGPHPHPREKKNTKKSRNGMWVAIATQSAPNPSCTIRPHDCFVLTIDTNTTVTATGTHETHLSGTFVMQLILYIATPSQNTNYPTNYPLQSYETRKLWKDVRIKFCSPVLHTRVQQFY